MKILFALNQDKSRNTEEAIISAYAESTGVSAEYNKEYDLAGVKNSLITKAYDIVFLNEELERDNPISTSFVDEITDKFPNLRIIILVTSEHIKDNYIKRIFNLGIYDILYAHDISFENLVKLIATPRTKAEAKEYLDLSEVEDVFVESELRTIPDSELNSIVSYFESSDKSECPGIFNHVDTQYNKYQMVYLIRNLPLEVRMALSESDCQLYQKYADLLDQPEHEQEYEEHHKVGKASKSELFKMPQFNKRDKADVRTVEKTVEKIVEKEVVRIQKEKEYINIVPSDYKKVVAFVGTHNAGTTTIVDLVAREFTSRGKKVAVLDFAKNRSLYYMKCWGREDLSVASKSSLKTLSDGKAEPVEVSSEYHLYTSGDENADYNNDEFNFYTALELIRYNYDIILLDLDMDHFSKWLSFGVSTIYLVNDLNIVNMVAAKKYIKQLTDIGVNSKKIHLIVNKYLKSKSKAEDILSCITKPLPHLEYNTDDSCIDINTKILKVGFDLDFYRSHMESLLYVGEKVDISSSMKAEILEICQEIYPLDTSGKKGKGIFSKILPI